MQWFTLFSACLIFLSAAVTLDGGSHEAHIHHHGKGHHHHHHHGRHHKALKHPTTNGTLTNKSRAVDLDALRKVFVSINASKQVEKPKTISKDAENHIFEKMKKLEAALSRKAKKSPPVSWSRGQLFINGPLPDDFSDRFARGVAAATSTASALVHVVEAIPMPQEGGNIVEVVFQAPASVVHAVANQAADADSKLASGSLRMFLVAKSDKRAAEAPPPLEVSPPVEDKAAEPQTPVADNSIDVDTQMPYGDLEPFGREDTAQELTESSVRESDEMVDQLERAEVAEEKRAVFRALTRLRGAAITSFDGVARSQTGNIDEYNKVHKWRNTHPLHHLADEESDISKWAFPDNADF